MAKIVVIGCGSAGQILAESLQDKMPDADFVLVNHFETGESSTVATRINTRLKRKLTDDELCRYETDVSKLKCHEKSGETYTYWWWRNKNGYRYPGSWDLILCGIALVKGQDIVATVSNGFPAQMAGKLDGYPDFLSACEY